MKKDEIYEPRYTWKRTQIDENDPPTDFDWTGYDGEMIVGRIQKEHYGPIKGKWRWAGSYPKWRGVRPHTPNAGFVDTARLAVRKCEEYWDVVCTRYRADHGAEKI